MNAKRSIVALLLVAWVLPLVMAAPVQGTPGTDPPDRVPVDDVRAGKAAAPPGDLATTLAGSEWLLSCEASGTTYWTTTSSDFEVIRQCTIGTPRTGYVFISANAWLLGDRYEAEFALAKQTGSSYYSIQHAMVDVYPVPPDGTSKSVALSASTYVGPHFGGPTFYLMARRTEYSNPVEVWDPTLTVIFVPSTNTEILTCSDWYPSFYTSESSLFSPTARCSLELPAPGWVYLSASAWVSRLDGPYQATYRIGIDDTTAGEPDTDRNVDVYDDQGNGTDKSVAVSILKPIEAGVHDFYFLHRRFLGPGRAFTSFPSIEVIYIPADNTQILHCESTWSTWFYASQDWGIVRQCSLTLPTPRWVFISTNAWLYGEGDYTAHFRIGIDDPRGDYENNRYVDLYDEMDETVALSVLKRVPAGTHTFYFVGRRESGEGTIVAGDPTLTVMALPNLQVFLPLVIR